jgi:hypothetical protein
MRTWVVKPVHAWIGVVVVLSCAGCGKTDDADRYSPPEDKARAALEAALNSWKEGRTPGRIDGDSLAVEAVDSRWSEGLELADFQILGVEPAEGAKCFLVELQLKENGERQSVRYFVVGRDPIWVYREEDYNRPDGM